MKDSILFSELLRLVQQFEHDQPITLLEEKISNALKEDDLNKKEDIPAWLPEMIRILADGVYSDWIDFNRPDWDDSTAMDFLTNLKNWLPCDYINNEESRLFIFPDLNLELCIFLEGSCFKVSAMGMTWK